MTPNSAVYVLLAAHILSMLGFSTYAALLPELRDEWHMSNAQAGIVSGMFFAGYIGTVSLWTSLTDRIDARKIASPRTPSSAGIWPPTICALVELIAKESRRGRRRRTVPGA